MLGHGAEARHGDALERHLGFLHRQRQQRHHPLVSHRLGQLPVVLRDVVQRPARRLLDARVDVLQAAAQRRQSTRGDGVGGEVRGVLGHGADDEGRGNLVAHVVRAEVLDHLGQQAFAHHALCHLLALGGQPAQRDLVISRCGRRRQEETRSGGVTVRAACVIVVFVEWRGDGHPAF